MSHSKYSPSASGRWLSCTSSVDLISKGNYEEKSSIYADVGTACHHLAEALLKDSYYSLSDLLSRDEVEDIVKPYVAYVRKIPADKKLYEKKVKVCKDCWGTADCIAYDSNSKTLHVIDLKAGRGIKVYAVDNTQLQIYAIGALKLFPNVESVVLHIVQPAIGNYSTTSVDLDTLLELDTKIKTTIKEIERGELKFMPSESACRWCPAKVDCPELFSHALISAKEDFKHVCLDNLHEKMKLVAPLKLWIKEVEEKSYERLEQGKNLQGFKLVNGRGSRSWREDKIEQLKTLVDKDTLYESKIVSVAKLEKIIKKSDLEIEIDEFFEKTIGKPKMVPTENPQKEIDKVEDAKNDFESITT